MAQLISYFGGRPHSQRPVLCRVATLFGYIFEGRGMENAGIHSIPLEYYR
jgi:hypothetical protein